MPYADPITQREAQAAHYITNKPKYLASSQASRQRRREKLRRLKEEPCVDCGVSYHPDVMQFHHIDPTKKLIEIASAMDKWGWGRIEAEIRKCVLLCSNCHILRHVALRMSSA